MANLRASFGERGPAKNDEKQENLLANLLVAFKKQEGPPLSNSACGVGEGGLSKIVK